MALVVVVPGPGGPGPRSVGSGGRRADPVQRVVKALASSVRTMRGPVPRADDVTVIDFADLFTRPAAEASVSSMESTAATNGRPEPAVDEQPAGETLVDEELVEQLLHAWWTAASRIDRFEAAAGLRGDETGSAQLSAALGESMYFRGSPQLAGIEARALSRYLTDLKLRHEARDRTQGAILPDTRVVVGHGIGALIAYEALCALGDGASVTFVSLGAAICGPEQVFARLEPAPRNGQGQWPAAVRRWFNVVAHSDPTAMIAPQLTERFGAGIEDEIVEIKSASGDVQPYLLDRAVGRALASGLSGG